jgi:hypothetical protein
LYAFLIYPRRSLRPVHVISVYFTALAMLDADHNSRVD